VRAFMAWIQFWKKEGAGREGALTLTIQTLREVLRTEPTFAMGYYFIGELLKMGNDMNRAENAFRAAVSHDPELIEAQRELRLLVMRRTRR
jgi:cytochrome c-type biogenesis protein CcmH/NrfG